LTRGLSEYLIQFGEIVRLNIKEQATLEGRIERELKLECQGAIVKLSVLDEIIEK
jgi:hypothetical protein